MDNTDRTVRAACALVVDSIRTVDRRAPRAGPHLQACLIAPPPPTSVGATALDKTRTKYLSSRPNCPMFLPFPLSFLSVGQGDQPTSRSFSASERPAQR